MKVLSKFMKSTFYFFLILLGISHFSLSAPQKVFTGSPEAYYNEALAEKDAGDLPAASLALRRALVLDPTLKVAQQQLQEVLPKLGLPTELTWQQKLASRCAPEKIVFIGTIIGWSTTFLLVLFFFLQILSSTKKPKRWGLFFVFLFFCLVGHGISVLGVIIDPRLRARYEVVVLPKTDAKAALEHRPERSATCPLRATPADAASAIAQLPTGSCLTLLSSHGAWSYIRTATGQEGWMTSGSLEFLIPKK